MASLSAVSDHDETWFALSHAQRGVWLDVKLIDRPAAYQVGSLVEIEGRLDPDLAREALRLMVGRHDALRLRIDADAPRQRFVPLGAPPFRLLDLCGEADPVAAAQAHVRAVQAEGFRLGGEPLFRLDLMKLALTSWRLLLLGHHLITDGISITLAQKHWLDAYNALVEEAEEGVSMVAGEPPARSSYAPVVSDDAAYEASARYAEDLDHWIKRLSPRPALVFEHRPAPQGQAAGPGVPPPRSPFVVGAEAFARFEAAARAAGSTTHRALVAVLALALSRRSTQTDFTLGMALHRRDQATRHVLGMLAGVIAVRCRVDPARTLLANVQRICTDLDADLRHQRAPIDAVGRRLAVEAPLAEAGGRLFDVAVTIMPAMRGEQPSLAGARMISRPVRSPEETPLAVYIYEIAEGGLSIQLGFNPAVLSSEEVDRIQRGFADMMEAFASRPERRLSAVPRLTAEEDEAIAAWSQGTAMDVPDATLPQLFAERAAADPDAPALLSDGGTLTYRDLDRASSAVAARLAAEGIAPRSVVGVQLARSMASTVALLGILKAGCVYLPLDPVYPDPRLHDMMEDAAVSVVLTDAEGAGRLPAGVAAIRLDEIGPDAEPAAEVASSVSSADLAYIIFTSGSTGRPKGVAMSHRAAVNLAFARREHDPIGPGDRVLAAISIGFDVSIGQLLLPLLSGAAVVVAGEIRDLSPQDFWAFMVRHGVTHVNSVPSFLESVLSGAPEATALKQIMLGGEGLSGALAARLRERLGVPVVNMYGPTETCIDATAFPVPASGFGEAPILPIGRPLPNYSLHVLDRALKPVAIGAEGELFIGGAGLAEGYLGPEERTAERFVETALEGRLYRTGDRALWREDGCLAFLGRSDGQVKIRGHRVEPGEIEAALRSHASLVQAAVIARPDARGQMRLLAYGVAADGATPPSAEALRLHLAARLPGHMIPAEVTLLEALPLTPNGKLDTRELPDPLPLAESLERAAPRDRLDEDLRDIWKDALGLDAIGIDENLLRIGGHSLVALRIAAEVRDRLGIDMPIGALFRHPTIRALSDALRVGLSGAGNALVPLGETGRGRPVFCVHPVGGSALVYTGLAASLSGIRPVLGLQASGLQAGQPLAASLEAMASAYLDVVRERQPAGPYTLLGHSFGGLVAFEMARQLESVGETVERLVMLDTSSPAAELGLLPPADLARMLLAAERDGLGGGDFAAEETRIEAVIAHNISLIPGHRPARLDAPLVYIGAARLGGDEDRAAHWLGASRSPVDGGTMACDHFDMLRPERIGSIAEALAMSVRTAEAA